MNIKQLRERLNTLNRRGDKPRDIWKPKDEHEVRCLPYPHGKEPMLPLAFHYDVGDSGPILCPKENFANECAVCDFCDRLKAWKDADGNDKPEKTRKEDFELFKKFQPKSRVFVPIVERGKEGEGAKFWGVTPNQANEILGVCADADRLDDLSIDKDDEENMLKVIFSPEKAYDLKVSFAKPGEKGNTKNFAQVEIKGKIKATPLSKDRAEAKRILDSVKNIREVYPEVSSAEVQRLVDRWTGSMQKEADTAPPEEKYETKSKEKVASGGRSIEDAFDDMVAEA